MDGDPIEATHHVARVCKNTAVVDGRPQGSAFQLREGELGLSVNDLERTIASESRLDQLRAMRQALIASQRTVKKKDWFAILSVADVTAIRPTQNAPEFLSVIHKPKPFNPAHACIFNLPPLGDPLAVLVGISLAQVAASNDAVQSLELDV